MLDCPAPRLSENYQAVELGATCLRLISGVPVTEFAHEHGEGAVLGKHAEKKLQRERKKSRSGRSDVVIERKHFDALGVKVPRTREDVEHVTKKLLEDQKSILEVSP